MIKDNLGIIDHCVVRSGKMTSSGSIASFAGWNYGTIQNCVNMADIKAIHDRYAVDASGIASWNMGSIKNCLNLGSIYAESSVSDATASGITYSAFSTAVCSGSANAGKIEAVTFGEYCKSPARNIAYHESTDYVYDCYATQRYDDDSFPEVISIVSRDKLLSMWSDVLN